MKRVQYEIHINAPVEKVEKTMLNPITYKEWTAIFNPTSYLEGEWKTGNEMRFLSKDENGHINGLYSLIAEYIPQKKVIIQHQGEIINGNKKITEEAPEWQGSEEIYSFQEVNGVTIVQVAVDLPEEAQDYFDTKYPEALYKLKTMCEINNNA